MYCPTCGQENPDDARVCRSCNSVLTRTPTEAPTIAVRTSGMAIAALVLGILSIFTLGLTGIPAIILGIISLVTIGQSGGRLTGKGFAIGGIITPVLAVPVLLMIILMPALNRVKKQAQSVACQSQLKQWSLLFNMYTSDNDAYFFSETPDDFGPLWTEPLRPYFKDDLDILQCPAAVRPYSGGGRNPFGAWEVGDDSGSYGLNGWVCNLPRGKRELRGHGPRENFCMRTYRFVAGGNNTPLLLDSMWCEGWPRQDDKPPPDQDWLKDQVNQSTMKANEDEMRRFCVNRHQGFANSLFMDWSVRKVGLKEMWTLKWHRQFNTEGPWTMAGGAQWDKWPQWMRKFRDY